MSEAKYLGNLSWSGFKQFYSEIPRLSLEAREGANIKDYSKQAPPTYKQTCHVGIIFAKIFLICKNLAYSQKSFLFAKIFLFRKKTFLFAKIFLIRKNLSYSQKSFLFAKIFLIRKNLSYPHKILNILTKSCLFILGTAYQQTCPVGVIFDPGLNACATPDQSTR